MKEMLQQQNNVHDVTYQTSSIIKAVYRFQPLRNQKEI